MVRTQHRVCVSCSLKVFQQNVKRGALRNQIRFMCFLKSRFKQCCLPNRLRSMTGVFVWIAPDLCATLMNLCFVSLESQPYQPAVISKNPDQQPLKQTGGPPATGGQRCVSEHAQLSWLMNIRVYLWTLVLYVCDRVFLCCSGDGVGRSSEWNLREGGGGRSENGVCITGTRRLACS